MKKNEDGEDYIYIVSKLTGQDGLSDEMYLDEYQIDYVDEEGWYGLTYLPNGITFDIKNVNDIYEITRAFENVEEDSKTNSSTDDDDDFPMTLQYNVEYFTKDGKRHYEEMALTEASQEAALTVLQDYRGLNVKEIVSIVRAEEDWDKSHSKSKGVKNVESNIHMAWSTTQNITDDIRRFIVDSYEAAGEELAEDVIAAIEKGIELGKMDIR
jgi:hypothetical protein